MILELVHKSIFSGFFFQLGVFYASSDRRLRNSFLYKMQTVPTSAFTPLSKGMCFKCLVRMEAACKHGLCSFWNVFFTMGSLYNGLANNFGYQGGARQYHTDRFCSVWRNFNFPRHGQTSTFGISCFSNIVGVWLPSVSRPMWWATSVWIANPQDQHLWISIYPRSSKIWQPVAPSNLPHIRIRVASLSSTCTCTKQLMDCILIASVGQQIESFLTPGA